MSQEIILYDLPSRPHPDSGKIYSWSANTWKTRLVLNYKQIPYKTEWVPFTKLQEVLSTKGMTPYPQPNWSDYSVPTVQLPDGSHMMDSLKIAPKLEELKPEPSLYLETKLHEEASKAIGAAFQPLMGYFMPKIVDRVVAFEDVDWFHADRSKKFGMSMEQLDKEKGGDKAIANAQPGLDKMVEVLTEHKKDEGPFILGSVPSYGDFVLVAGVYCFKMLGEEDYERMVEGRKELRELYEACKPWLERDD